MASDEGKLPEGGGAESPIANRSGKRKQSLRLRILLDTNQLFTGSASHLLKADLETLIKESRSHPEISIEWLVPEIVRCEREYQMTNAARSFMPTLTKLERLLGHNLAITDEILSDRVREAISRQIRELELVIVPLEVASVDWNAIVQGALFRRPPFEKGEKEKGFRDALVAECFMFTINESPKNPSDCRVAIVTADGLLADMMAEQTANRTNVQVLRNLDDLQNLINTLVSNVKEQFIATVRETAKTYFFTKGSKDCLYYRLTIRNNMEQEFTEKLSELPPGTTSRENGTWYVGSPSFVEKKRQRIFWRTSIRIAARAYLESAAASAPYWSARPGPFAGTRRYGSSTNLFNSC